MKQLNNEELQAVSGGVAYENGDPREKQDIRRIVIKKQWWWKFLPENLRPKEEVIEIALLSL